MPDYVVDLLKIYGIPGVFLLLFLTGKIIPKPVHDREVSRADEAEKMLKVALESAAALARVLKP